MNRRKGVAIIREPSTWSSVAPLLKWAFGFLAAWVWFFTPTIASCSSVVPYAAMWRWAASAKQGGAVSPKAASHSRSTPVPMLRIASSPVGALSFSRSEEHTSELQSRLHLVCRLLLEKKKKNIHYNDDSSASSQLESQPT